MAEPYCLAMVLCDGAHRDATTGKFTILGTFSTFQAQRYPTNVEFTVYSALTDGLGPTEIKLRLVDAKSGIAENDDKPLFEGKLKFDFQGPLMVLESALPINAELPAAGIYHCELYANDSLVMSRRLLAIELRKLHKGENDG